MENVAIICPLVRLSNNEGGSRRTLYTARFLKELGYKVTLFTIEADYEIKNEFKTVKLKEYKSMYHKNILREFLKEINLIPSSLIVFIKLLLSDFKIIHIYSSRIILQLSAFLVAKMKGMKIIFEYRDLIPEGALIMRGMKPHSFIYFLLLLYEKIAFKLSDIVIVVSSTMKEILLQRNNIDPKRIIVMYPPLERFPVKYSKKFIRRKYNLPLGRVIMIYLGRLEPKVRGLEMLLESFQKALKKVSKEIFLLLVGDGPLKTFLEKRAKELNIHDKVIFTGQLSHEDALEYLYCSDIALIPYPRSLETEIALPAKLVEYMESGKIIISSDLKEIRKILNGYAIFFKPEDPNGLVNAICFAVSHISEIRYFGKKVKKIARTFYWDNQKIVLKKIYRKISEKIKDA